MHPVSTHRLQKVIQSGQELTSPFLTLSSSSRPPHTEMSQPVFHPDSFLRTLRRHLRRMSTPLLYSALLMYYAFRRSETPSWAKRIVLGAFVYLLSPFDAIPDLSPLLGYTDDLGVLSYGLVMIAAYINPEVRLSARKTLTSWIGEPDEATLASVDRQL